jgi:hypothetical protein
MVAGKDEAVNFIEKHAFLEGYLIWSDEKGEMRSWVSEGLRQRIEEN